MKSKIPLKKKIKRTQSGRYVVRLLFVEIFVLGDSSNHALKVFYALDRKFESDLENYSILMEECKNENTYETFDGQ